MQNHFYKVSADFVRMYQIRRRRGNLIALLAVMVFASRVENKLKNISTNDSVTSPESSFEAELSFCDIMRRGNNE